MLQMLLLLLQLMLLLSQTAAENKKALRFKRQKTKHLFKFALSFFPRQVDIKQKSDGYTTQARDDSALTKEIYTSMHELELFFEKEKQYVEDIRIIMDKKLVFPEGMGALGAYIASYDDVIGDQVL